MAIIATPGAADANSYGTEAEADDYFETRLHSEAWDAADTEAALINATRLLDAYICWTGSAVDAVQALAWPRTGMLSKNGFPIPTSGADSIPIQLKYAQFELALLLAAEEDRTLENEIAVSGLNKLKVGPVELGWKDGIESIGEVVNAAVRALLVPSWLCPTEEALGEPFMFEVLG